MFTFTFTPFFKAKFAPFLRLSLRFFYVNVTHNRNSNYDGRTVYLFMIYNTSNFIYKSIYKLTFKSARNHPV